MQIDSLIEAFGTNKQKKALNSRRLNKVNSDMLQQAVIKAANTVIDEKGLDGKQKNQEEHTDECICAINGCLSDWALNIVLF